MIPVANARADGSGAAFVDTLDVLLANLFDFAGMFPPAQLPFDEALREAASFETTLRRPHLVGAEGVFDVGRFVDLSDDRLAESGFPPGAKIRWVALAPSRSLDDLDSLAEDILPLTERNASHSLGKSSQSLESVDVRLKVLPEAVERLEAVLQRFPGALAAAGIRCFLEPIWTAAEWMHGIRRISAVLAAVNAHFPGAAPWGLKVRGSGPQALDREALSAVIDAVCENVIPLKATAGLHHPICEPERYGNALGFLNFATALRLRQALGRSGFGRKDMARCLETASIGEFQFWERLQWQEFSISDKVLAAAQNAMPLRIGSCSLKEPDGDLQRLLGE